MVAETSARTKESRMGSSGIFMILWSVVCVGVGTIGGFATFFMLYQKECNALVQSSREGALDHARSEMRRELDECQFHTQALKSQLKSATQRFEETQESLEAQYAQNVAKLEEELRHQTAESRLRIVELEQQQEQDRSNHAKLAQKFHALQATLQKRYLEETKLRYGDQNIIVELSLDMGNGEDEVHNIVVSLDRIDVLPMTTALFLFLVEANLYTGAQIIANADVLHGMVATTDTAHWQEQGINPHTPLLWASEASQQQAPCPKYGFGIDWEMARGGDFFITLDNAASENSRTCLGRVVSGSQYLTSQTNGKLSSTKILPISDASKEEL